MSAHRSLPRELLHLAWPVLIGQLSVLAFGTVDTLLVARYAAEDLEQWAECFRKARTNGKDCYAYCKHEDEGSPWIWANQLLRLTESSPLPG